MTKVGCTFRAQKVNSHQWFGKKKDEPAPKKFKQQLSAGKVMLTFIWDSKGVLLKEYMPQGSTVNSASSFNTLMKLRMAIKSKRPGLLR